VLSDDIVKTLPATRGYNAIVFLVPSVTGGSNQIDLMPAMRIFTVTADAATRAGYR
jgi:hypothetical protein